MTDILFKNFALLDAEAGRLLSGFQVLVRGTAIAKVAKGAIRAPGAKVVDLKGRTLMPGLVDCHIHICMPPTGMVSWRLSNPAISGRARGIIARTCGNCSDAVWLAWLSHTSVTQIASASTESLATI